LERRRRGWRNQMRSRNIDHKTLIQVWEWQNFKSCPEDSMTLDLFDSFFYLFTEKILYHREVVKGRN
jgi:hypothetical protein